VSTYAFGKLGAYETANKHVKYTLGRWRARAKRILDEIEERRDSRKLDWECISKPLKENPNDMGNIHKPTIEEYRMTYCVDGKVKTKYDWWYSAILGDEKGKLFFFILSLHPKWGYYRLVDVDIDQSLKNRGSLPEFPVESGDFREEIGYSEHKDAIDIWVPKIRELKSSKESFVQCTIKPGESHLTLKTEKTAVDLNFTSLGLPFWINKGREAVCSPKGDTMSGFWDVSKVEGFFMRDTQKTRMAGMGFNEHLFSLASPKRFWQRVDGIFLCSDQICCAFWHLESKIGTRQYEYKDGAVFIRETREYLIPTDFEIEYLELDSLKRPIRIRISADIAKGKLEVVALAIAETEKQLALKITGGQFVFGDGRRLKLTNGYGQHALW
jgi:hypothetical protein